MGGVEDEVSVSVGLVGTVNSVAGGGGVGRSNGWG